MTLLRALLATVVVCAAASLLGFQIHVGYLLDVWETQVQSGELSDLQLLATALARQHRFLVHHFRRLDHVLGRVLS